MAEEPQSDQTQGQGQAQNQGQPEPQQPSLDQLLQGQDKGIEIDVTKSYGSDSHHREPDPREK